MLSKEEVIKFIAGAQSQINDYESKIYIERNKLKEIKENCPHEYGDNPFGEGLICKICDNIMVEEK